MFCPNCKTENATGTLFCTHCGRSLARFSADVPQMVWQAQDGTTQSFVVSGAITIGRSAGSDIVIPDSAMSRQHARVEIDAGGARISDLGSLNGVSVNGERISEPYPIAGGDLIRIGHTIFTFEPAATPPEARSTMPMEAIDDPGASPGENPSLPTVAMGNDSEEVPDAGGEEVSDAAAEEIQDASDDDRTVLGPGGTESPFAAVQEAPIAGYLINDALRVPIRAELSVGRAEGSDLRIESDRSMSRNHARIEVLPDGIHLEDLNSANGTFLNGARLTGQAMLTNGAEIRFGASTFRFEANAPTQPPAPAGVDLGTEAIVAVQESDVDSGATIISALDSGATMITDMDSGATMIAENIQEQTLQGSEADLYLREAQLAE
ncbi:MAG: domain/tetratricopeptide repeat protein [Chloroflexi bacterium]|nr:domain/tetratricopeptide repeat protein [Chloroflexota bacterium]